LVELSVAAATPTCSICWTWSRISAISGETTTVSPPSTMRRQLVAHRFAGTGRHHREHRLAAHHRCDDLVLAGTEIIIAKDGFERGAGAR
jgi:hypothetical protein